MSESDTLLPRAGSRRRGLLCSALRAGEYTLALVGSACLIAYGGACARATITQHNESEAFDAAVRARIEARQQQIQAESTHRNEWSRVRVAKYEATLSQPVHAI